jgi:XTP/dITP diphosphohydrolase
MIILVTHNKHKFAEASELAKHYGAELAMPPNGEEKMEIQADSLKEVSRFAAAEAYGRIGLPILVDDSGLFVHALGNFPGVYSAPALDTIGTRGILRLMDGVKDRKAHFECCVSFADGNSVTSFIGRVNGDILLAEKGANGFGYDPIFAPEGYNGKSLAEVEMKEKNMVSHRGKAFEAFFKWYFNERQKRGK